MEYLIYKHTSPSGKVYIGQTCQDVNKRWCNGYGYLNKHNGKYTQPLVAKAIIKYGWDNFTHEVLYDGLTKEEIRAKQHERYQRKKALNQL